MTTAKMPILVGRYWRMPDGGIVPNICGGNTEDDFGDAGDAEDARKGSGEANDDPLRNELKAVRAEAAKYRVELKAVKEASANVDMEKYNAMLEAEQNAERQKVVDKGNYDEALAEATRRHDTAMVQADKNTDHWKGLYSKQVVDNVLLARASERAIDPSEVVTLIRSQFDFEVSDAGTVDIKDLKGDIVIGDGGKPLTAEEVMNNYLDKKLHLCKPKGGGGGSRGNVGDSGGSDNSDMTAQQRIEAGLRKRLSVA